MIRDRFNELGLVLPDAPKPVAAYVPAVRTGNLIFVSGQLPLRDGELIAIGKVPTNVDVDTAKACARQCALNGLAIVAAELGGGVDGLDKIVRIVRLGCFVACDPSFSDPPKVANGASELVVELFGDRGKHARAAVGCASLPLDVPVEIEMTVEVR